MARRTGGGGPRSNGARGAAMTNSFMELAPASLGFTADIVCCTVTTVDGAGRPRSRVMHPVLEVVDGLPRGWAVTDRSPVKARHLASNPFVCCGYWSAAHNTVTADCEARRVEDEDEETKQHGWDLFRDTPPSLGWSDLAAYEPERTARPLQQPSG